jgi:selenium metabolism protein YedF
MPIEYPGGLIPVTIKIRRNIFMNDIEIVDARGLGCPQPVILAKKAIEQKDRILVLVDNEIALENVKRLGTKVGCEIQVARKEDGTYQIHLSKTQEAKRLTDEEVLATCVSEPGQQGPFVLVFSENRMGRGNDELGYVLIKAFIHTLCQQETKPDTIIFYNTGVKLTVKDSEVIDDLQQLAKVGVEMLVCGTCVNYFDITKDMAVGTISNMYDIAGLLSRAGRLVTP